MPIWDVVCDGVIWLKDIILGICDVLGGIFIEIWNGVIDAWNFMKKTVSDLCDTITNIFLKAWDGIMKALDTILHPIETAKNAFGKRIQVTGTFFHSHTGHHFTPVLMTVSEVKILN